jgi:hypothetical protein
MNLIHKLLLAYITLTGYSTAQESFRQHQIDQLYSGKTNIVKEELSDNVVSFSNPSRANIGVVPLFGSVAEENNLVTGSENEFVPWNLNAAYLFERFVGSTPLKGTPNHHIKHETEIDEGFKRVSEAKYDTQGNLVRTHFGVVDKDGVQGYFMPATNEQFPLYNGVTVDFLYEKGELNKIDLTIDGFIEHPSKGVGNTFKMECIQIEGSDKFQYYAGEIGFFGFR